METPENYSIILKFTKEENERNVEISTIGLEHFTDEQTDLIISISCGSISQQIIDNVIEEAIKQKSEQREKKHSKNKK